MSQPAVITKLKRAVRDEIKDHPADSDGAKLLLQAYHWLSGVGVHRAFDILTVRAASGGWEHRLRYGVLGFSPANVLVTIPA